MIITIDTDSNKIINTTLSDDEKAEFENIAEHHLEYEIDNTRGANSKYKWMDLLMSMGTIEHNMEAELEYTKNSAISVYKSKVTLDKYKEYFYSHVNSIDDVLNYIVVQKTLSYTACYNKELKEKAFDKFIDKLLDNATKNNVCQLLRNLPSDKYSKNIVEYVHRLQAKATDDAYTIITLMNKQIHRISCCTEEDEQEINDVLMAINLLKQLAEKR
jgi:hypothetical protein